MSTSDMTDRDYEVLIQKIHQAIIHNQGASSIVVEHDKKVLGRSGQKHQIDVYWSYSLGGVTYQTAIECRKYKNAISVGKIRDFHSVLNDIGNINGIMITTKGFQAGAIHYADHYGIRLSVLRDIVDIDIQGFIHTIVVNIQAVLKKVVNWNLSVSEKWIAGKCLNRQENMQITGMNNEIGLHDASGVLVKSFHEIENSLPYTGEDGLSLPENSLISYNVDIEGMYLMINSELIPITSLIVGYTIHKHTFVSESKDSHPPQFVLENHGEDRKTLHIHSNQEMVIRAVPRKC